MSPRPRKASDAEIFAAAHRIMTRLGPAQWTLADLAAEVGLTPGALVQRFGSKRELMVALTAQVAAATPGLFARLRAAHPSPLAAVRAYADGMAAMGESPGGLAHHLAYLQLDLTDPDLHRHVREQARASRAGLRELLDAAAAAGELPPEVDTAELARVVEATVGGSLMSWAFYQEGPAARWVRRDVDAVLAAFAGAAQGGGTTAAAAASGRRSTQRRRG